MDWDFGVACRQNIINWWLSSDFLIFQRSEVDILRDKKTAILFGVETEVGAHCNRLLLDHPAYSQVFVFVAYPLSLKHARLKQFSLKSFLSGEISRLEGNDLFYCTNDFLQNISAEDQLNSAELARILPVAKLAAKGGVNQFLVLSSAGANPESLIPLLKMKGQIAEILSKMSFWGVHLFKPVPIRKEQIKSFWGHGLAFLLQKGAAQLDEDLAREVTPLRSIVIAKAMVNAAQQLEKGYHIYNNESIERLGKA